MVVEKAPSSDAEEQWQQAEKATQPPGVTSQSVIDRPAPSTSPQTPQGLLWFVAQAADEMTPWGRNPKLRDRQLRDFWPTESQFAAGLGVVCSRNSGFAWQIEGPPRLSSQMQDVLENANMGEGWQDLLVKVSTDVYTQDNGAFLEVVRQTDSPDAPLVGLNHLDAQRCWHTGAPEAPVIYLDRKGKYHLLKWYQVVTLSEMPAPVEGWYGLQFCALSRMLKAAKIFKNISTYIDEKTGGRHNRAVHIVSGVTSSQVNEAMDAHKQVANLMGLQRYLQPLVVGAVDPKANVDVKTIELASLPDGFDQEVTWKQYIAIMAMAFLSDFQEFAPLPGGNLGTSAQSEVLHMKTRGKGPAIFMKMITHALNFKILPSAVEFSFAEQDIEEENQEAEVQLKRAQARKFRIDSGELFPQEAAQIAVDVGDLPQELFDARPQIDLTPPAETVTEQAKPESVSPTNVTQQENAQPSNETAPAPAKEVGRPQPFRFKFEDYI